MEELRMSSVHSAVHTSCRPPVPLADPCQVSLKATLGIGQLESVASNFGSTQR